jgi:hypothetical protein
MGAFVSINLRSGCGLAGEPKGTTHILRSSRSPPHCLTRRIVKVFTVYIHDHPAPFSEQPQPKASLSLPRSLLTLASIWASSPPLVSQRRKPMSPNAMKSYGLPSSPLRAASPALLLLRNRLTMPWFPPVLYRWQQVPQIRSRLKRTSSNMATLTFSAAKSSSSFPASRRRSGMRSVSWSLSYGQPGGHMPGPTA